MKKALLLAVSLFTFVAIAPQQAQAQGHSHFTKIPETVEGIWKAIGDHQTKLTAVVAAKNLGEAHDHGYAIRDLVKALPAKVAPDKKTKADEGAAAIIKLAAALDKASAAKSQKATEASVKELETAVATLKTNLEAK